MQSSRKWMLKFRPAHGAVKLFLHAMSLSLNSPSHHRLKVRIIFKFSSPKSSGLCSLLTPAICSRYGARVQQLPCRNIPFCWCSSDVPIGASPTAVSHRHDSEHQATILLHLISTNPDSWGDSFSCLDRHMDNNVRQAPHWVAQERSSAVYSQF